MIKNDAKIQNNNFPQNLKTKKKNFPQNLETENTSFPAYFGDPFDPFQPIRKNCGFAGQPQQRLSHLLTPVD